MGGSALSERTAFDFFAPAPIPEKTPNLERPGDRVHHGLERETVSANSADNQ
jgi:hypothetical protein